MKKLTIKPNFVLLLSEITFLCSLGPNAHDTELSSVEKRQLSNIYYKYFGSLPISEQLIENEMKQKWPGGERKKAHECQRGILGVLHKINSMFPVAGELIPATEQTLDLTWVMNFLNQATANDIAIVQMVTDVVTTVPVTASKDVSIIINGKRFNIPAGNYNAKELLAVYNEKYVPIEGEDIGYACKFKDDPQPALENEHERYAINEGGWLFIFTPTA